MKERQYYTSIDQANQLIALGIDEKTADMTWLRNPWTSEKDYGEDGYRIDPQSGAVIGDDYNGVPAWTAETMLGLLPEYIKFGEDVGHIYIYRDFHHHWVILYECNGSGNGYAVNKQPTLLLAAFEMLKWWLANKDKLATDNCDTITEK